uniref:F-box domain-containing protein n=1 Tax=Hordeum vulgare subsp. vulgare TaxID=112509 RepID=A0A8I6XZC7_HORVV
MDGADGNGICFPYDVLVDIFRRLPCRPLVESRRVCRTWRTIVDAHKLLLRYFFPGSPFPGIFTTNYGCDDKSSFFAPSVPTRSERLRGAHDGPVFRRPLFQHDCFSVLHCCNGLLLLKDRSRDHRYVCNPATVRIAVLPPLPEKETRLSVEDMFLAFDPAVSRHHEVFLLPEGKILPEENTQPQTWAEVNLEQLHLPMLFEEENLSEEDQDEIEITCHSDYARDSNTTQPSDVISVLVFSSQTNQWVNREFVPGHYAPKKLYDMVTAPHPSRVKTWKSAEYWQGSFYVHCWNNILLILRNSEGTYGMVELPGKACIDEHTSWSKLLESSVLASYERGVCYVAHDKIKLRVWTLMESDDDQVEWMLAHQAELSHEIEQWVDPRVPWKVVGNNKAIASLFEPYNVEEFMYDEEDSQSDTADDGDGDDGTDEAEDIHEADGFDDTANANVNDDGHDEEEEVDEDDGFESEESFGSCWDSDSDNFIDLHESSGSRSRHYKIVGLHPHKEVVLLQTHGAVTAYHIRTSRMQYLGHDLLRNPCTNAHGIGAAFPYRPCYVDALPATKLPYTHHFW